MGEVKWASGRWQVKEGKADEFVERWKAWLGWTSQNVPGFRSATLLRSEVWRASPDQGGREGE